MGGERREEVDDGQGTGKWKRRGKDSREREGRRGEGRKKERRGEGGEGKKSKNTPSVKFLPTPLLPLPYYSVLLLIDYYTLRS